MPHGVRRGQDNSREQRMRAPHNPAVRRRRGSVGEQRGIAGENDDVAADATASSRSSKQVFSPTTAYQRALVGASGQAVYIIRRESDPELAENVAVATANDNFVGAKGRPTSIGISYLLHHVSARDGRAAEGNVHGRHVGPASEAAPAATPSTKDDLPNCRNRAKSVDQRLRVLAASRSSPPSHLRASSGGEGEMHAVRTTPENLNSNVFVFGVSKQLGHVGPTEKLIEHSLSVVGHEATSRVVA